MAVYVDNMHMMPMGQFGRMKMCHMIADTDDELHAMADQIGIERRWHQKSGTPGSHYDIAMSKRDLAVKAGAIEITVRQAAAMMSRRRAEGRLGQPAEASPWRKAATRPKHARAAAPEPAGSIALPDIGY